jgi:hypothetical protein
MQWLVVYMGPWVRVGVLCRWHVVQHQYFQSCPSVTVVTLDLGRAIGYNLVCGGTISHLVIVQL